MTVREKKNSNLIFRTVLIYQIRMKFAHDSCSPIKNMLQIIKSYNLKLVNINIIQFQHTLKTYLKIRMIFFYLSIWLY